MQQVSIKKKLNLRPLSVLLLVEVVCDGDCCGNGKQSCLLLGYGDQLLTLNGW